MNKVLFVVSDCENEENFYVLGALTKENFPISKESFSSLVEKMKVDFETMVGERVLVLERDELPVEIYIPKEDNEDEVAYRSLCQQHFFSGKSLKVDVKAVSVWKGMVLTINPSEDVNLLFINSLVTQLNAFANDASVKFPEVYKQLELNFEKYQQCGLFADIDFDDFVKKIFEKIVGVAFYHNLYERLTTAHLEDI